jgi:hypothetical protein
MVPRHFDYFEPKELWLAFNLNDILFNPYESIGQEATQGSHTTQTTPTHR